MRPLQEFPNVLLEISTGVYLSFIKERSSAASLNLPRDLLGDLCVLPAVAYEAESRRSLGRLLRHRQAFYDQQVAVSNLKSSRQWDRRLHSHSPKLSSATL